MKIASFNINGIKARLPLLLDWLRRQQVDVAMLQEIKSTDASFPRQPIEKLGYRVETHGQKSFNGVAILSKYPLENISRGLPGNKDDVQARYMEATVIGKKNSVLVCNLYLPNGNPVLSDKTNYKFTWMQRLYWQARTLLAQEHLFFMAGDYNVIPQSCDCADVKHWQKDALYLPATRAAFRKILYLGLSDAFRISNQMHGHYTFWDYQGGAWERGNGIRIDHFLLSPACADMLCSCHIERDMRAAQRPSDHVPIWIELDI